MLNQMNPLLALVVGFVTAELAILATTVYLHRCMTHRALTMGPLTALPFRLVLWISTGIRPREWAGVHRRHHAALDTVDDPHSPLRRGFWRVQLFNIVMYHRAAHDTEQIDRYTRDIPRNRLDRYVFDRETIGPLVGLGLLCLVFGWQTGLLAGVFHLAFYVGLNGAVNAVGHTVGERPHANSATNGAILALLTAGEGLHNNHHAAPTAARFSSGRYEIDPAWWLIRRLERAKLLTLRHAGGLLPPKPDRPLPDERERDLVGVS
jgi:stearoyl-CoA desaturase (delta-9 desaturase)